MVLFGDEDMRPSGEFVLGREACKIQFPAIFLCIGRTLPAVGSYAMSKSVAVRNFDYGITR